MLQASSLFSPFPPAPARGASGPFSEIGRVECFDEPQSPDQVVKHFTVQRSAYQGHEPSLRFAGRRAGTWNKSNGLLCPN